MKMTTKISENTHRRPPKRTISPAGRVLLIIALVLTLYGWTNIVFPISAHQKSPLCFTPNHTFHISVFSDLHYGEDEDSFGIDQDIRSTALMRQVLDVERPDFVILNGDLITGENTFASNATQYIHQIVKTLQEGGFRWASTYGNHDSKYNLSREALFHEEKEYLKSYTSHGPPGTDGVTNYVLPVYGPDCLDQRSSTAGNLTPRALLWFFDSRGGAEYQHQPANVDNIENYVSNATVRWFQSTNEEIQRKHGPLPSLAFVHIPMKAFVDLQNQQSPAVHSPQYPGLNADVPVAQQGPSGTGSESVPFMQALLATEGLHSIYSGHDHGDSWCGRWPAETLPEYGQEKRPFLCFCKHSGFGGYGTWNRGVRQVRLMIDDDGAVGVDTWVRMEGGNVVTAVTLNETYGHDVYPVDDGGYHSNL